MPPPPKPSLPSIKEMFPEYLMNVPPHMRAPPPMVSPTFQTQLPRSNPVSDQNRPRSLSSSANIPGYSRQQHRRHSTNQGQSPRAPHAPHPAATAPPATRGFHHAHPDSLPHTQSSRDKSGLQAHSFDVLRSVPSSSSLQHINSSPTYSTRNGSAFHGPYSHAGVASGSTPVFQVTLAPQYPHHKAPARDSRPEQVHRQAESRDPPVASTSAASGYPAIISFPVNGSSSQRELSPDDGSGASDDGDLSGSNSGKKHVCTTCFKRFNRPSSLRIHVNTHTGATPFRCPWPGCGREFNVNSNMRRHYRNHNTPGFARSQPHDARRRRRRGPAPPHSASTSTSPTARTGAGAGQRYVASPPISSLSMSEDDSDDDMSDPMDDELEPEPESPRAELEFASRHHHSHDYDHQHRGAFGHGEHGRMARQQHYPRSHLRAFSGPPPSPSASPPSPPPPHLPEPVYSPSAPYVRSLGSRVSTALRPAFHPHPHPHPQRRPHVKQEPMPDVW